MPFVVSLAAGQGASSKATPVISSSALAYALYAAPFPVSLLSYSASAAPRLLPLPCFCTLPPLPSSSPRASSSLADLLLLPGRSPPLFYLPSPLFLCFSGSPPSPVSFTFLSLRGRSLSPFPSAGQRTIPSRAS